MRTESTLPQTVAIVLALLVVLLMMHFVPKPVFEPHGILLPAKVTLTPASPDQVRVYRSLPDNYQTLGRITIEMHAAKGANQRLDQVHMVTKAQSLAANVGANGIVFNIMYGGGQEGSALNSYYLIGYAFSTKVPDELNINLISSAE